MSQVVNVKKYFMVRMLLNQVFLPQNVICNLPADDVNVRSRTAQDVKLF